ncbi:MFS transporter [Arthrobacter sp. CJ23]|uniref:MFS transporter n=1 Tax=Arthrobacter sp. CJ23 TaxID=2972479 RepID=UPI00215D48ED|nr:MFS transporter [Arthrobacter sp. CJ23]UVJ38611.1 MFS transporter [Arthrobacter sp. CJ23]
MAAYGASGIAAATWVSRLPAVRNGLDLTPATVGLMLLCLTAASFSSVSVSGLVVLRLGSTRVARIAGVLSGSGLLLLGLGTSVLSSLVVAAGGLALLGLANGCYNTALNVEGAAVERALGKHVMPWLHGSFSLGTVAGAAAGAWAAAAQLSVAWHLGLVGAVAISTVMTASLSFRADRDGTRGGKPVQHRRADTFEDPSTGPLPVINPALASESAALHGKRLVAMAWREPRTLLLGLLLLGLALSEGAAGDWAALALTDGHGQTEAAGAAGYGVFVTFMTVGRFAGTFLLDRFGRVTVMRCCAALAFLGVTTFVFAPAAWIAFVGLGIWGLGTSLGFPVGMSAAADDPVHAAARVSVASTVAYGAFLCGPPVLGFLAEHVGILHSLLFVLLFQALSFFLAPVLRKPVHGHGGGRRGHDGHEGPGRKLAGSGTP